MRSKPLIVLDARLTRQMSAGMKAYVRELAARLPAVAPDLSFVAVSNVDLGASMDIVQISEKTAVNASLGEQLQLPQFMKRTGASLAHLMSLYAPRWLKMPYVYTIHDLIHRRFPHYFSWKIPPYYALVVGPVARRARTVITDAAATVPDLQRFLGVGAGKARVVPLGVSESFALEEAQRTGRGAAVRRRLDLSRPFFLYAGNHRPHKNLATLGAAWQRVQEPSDLVITESGGLGFDGNRFARSNGRIVLTGHLEEQDLVNLYAACSAVVQPSLYEGFGLSVLEAMSAGAPVVVAQTSALLEVAADAALSFPPLDVGVLTDALERLLRDPYLGASLRAKGRARAATYSWDETARRTAAVYRDSLS